MENGASQFGRESVAQLAVGQIMYALVRTCANANMRISQYDPTQRAQDKIYDHNGSEEALIIYK